MNCLNNLIYYIDDVELFYIEELLVWTCFSCIYDRIFKTSEKIKKKTCLQSVLIFIFTEFFTKILLTEILFFPFLQLCIALEILL